MSLRPELHNAHFDGDPFFFKGSRKSAVLLLHGLTATPFEVRGLGQALNQSGYTTTGPLLPGHGSTPAALNRVTWKDWYRTAETALSDLFAAYPRVYVGGESTGAVLALLLAARFPNIAGVLAYAPALRLPFTHVHLLLIRFLSRLNISSPKNDLENNTTWQGYRVNPLKAVNQLVRLQDALSQELVEILQPTLIVQGLRDKTIDISSAQMVYDGIFSALKEISWMEHSGHCVLLEEQSGDVIRLTLEFLEKVETSAAAAFSSPQRPPGQS